jgi:hypothetical protein
MKLKLSWGTGIVISFVVFMSSTLAVVIYLMNQDVDLVTRDYYKKELAYQDQIERIERTNKISDKQIINFHGELVSVTMPSSIKNSITSGEIYFYRPSDSKYDIRIPLLPDSAGIQIVPVRELTKGLWMVKVNWKTEKEEFFTEKRVLVQ